MSAGGVEGVGARLRRAFAVIARWLPAVAVTLACFGARYWYRVHLGVRFDAATTEYCIQFVDRAWLREDLGRTLWSLHHQAPLLDLVVGVALKLSATRFHDILDGLFQAIALGLALGMLSVLRRTGVRPLVATLAACLYTAAPTVVLYENWLLYHHLVTGLFVLSLAALQRFARRETLASGVAFFSSLALIVLTRATFGLVFMGAIAAALLFYRPVPRRLVLKAAAVPMLAIALYTAKTPLATGRSLGHALVGPNLVIKILDEIPPQERDILFRTEVLSPQSRELAFPNLERFREFRVEGVPVTGVPALDTLVRENGVVNANALQYAYMADVSMRDAKTLLRRYPRAYLRAVWSAVSSGYFRSAANDQNITKAFVYVPFKELEERFVKRFDPQPDESLKVLTVALPLALLYGFARLLSPRSWLVSQRVTVTALAMILATILYAASAVLVSYGDFARYRFEVDVLYVMLLAMLFDDALSVVLAVPQRLVALRRRRA